MISEDRELLAQLAKLNSDMATLALRIMEGSASTAEQQTYTQRLIAAGQQLHRRAQNTSQIVIGGEVLTVESITLPAQTVEPGHRDQRR